MKKADYPESPLTAEDVLQETFYSAPPKETKKKKKAKPSHYKICCISLYNEDIDNLNSMVKELKKRGHTKANKSQVIRFALANCNLDDMPKGY